MATAENNNYVPLYIFVNFFALQLYNILLITGLQLADELGFKESLSSLEQNSKRRSVNGLAAPGSFEPLTASQNTNNQLVSTAAQENNIK